MRLPRNLSGENLIKLLKNFGYRPTRQTGSHIRLTRKNEEGNEQHLTVPKHDPLRIGTLNSILKAASRQLKIEIEDILN